MKKIVVLVGLLLAMELNAICKETEVTYDITTGSKTGTYYQIGLNLAKYVAPDACINLKVLNSNGSLDNAFKLNSTNNIKFAIVQNDVLQELKKLAEEGNKKATKLVQNLRVITPLYNEEIHIIANANSNINTFGDLRDKKISIGKEKSGTAMTSYLLYKELFGEELKKARTQPLDEALKDLEEGHIDAIVKVAGQPVMRLSKKMTKDSEKYIKLLSYNEKNSAHNPISSYYSAEIKGSSYKWIENDVPTLSTKSYLITYNYTNKREKKYIKKFVKSLKAKLSYLKRQATNDLNTPHLKWREVSNKCMPKLPGGWKYYGIVNKACSNSRGGRGGCSPRDRATGLCN